MKILHADKGILWRELVKKFLEADGHEVVSVTCLTEADSVLHKQEHFDLVICDGTFRQTGDGVRWASELTQQGRKVQVLSCLKAGSDEELRETLRSMLKSTGG